MKTTMKDIFKIVTAFMIFNSAANAQIKFTEKEIGLSHSTFDFKNVLKPYCFKDTIASNTNKQDSANSFIYITAGLYEVLSVGFGNNLSDDWGLAIKANIFFLRSRFFVNAAAGFGIKIHKRIFKDKKFLFVLNTLNLEASIGSNNFNEDITKCREIQLNLSSENLNVRGFDFYFSAGIGYSYENRSGSLLMPTIKAGTIYNF